MAARRPFWKWRRWKSIGFCLWPPSTCIWNLKLKFQSKLDLCSGNHAVYRQTDGRTDGRTDRRTDKVNPGYPPSNFVGRVYNKKSNMAARRPFWKWRRWKSIGFCLWPPSTCIWNLKLKFQSKLDLCSGNHAVYRQTDGRTDGRTRWIQYTPPPTLLGGCIKIQIWRCCINISHHSDDTWGAWRLRNSTVVFRLNKGDIKAQHYCPCVRGIHR